MQGNFFERIWNVLESSGRHERLDAWSLGAISIAALLAPGGVVAKTAGFADRVTIVAITVMWTSNLEDRGIDVAGNIPGGLPVPCLAVCWAGPAQRPGDPGVWRVPALLRRRYRGRPTFAVRHKYEIDANQELYANGGANLVSGLMQGYSVGGSMSRSAVNDAAGARTPLAGLFAAHRASRSCCSS